MIRSPLALASAALSGVIFGFGLAIAQMTDPQKVLDFLDVAAIPAGGWDPSLAFVMGGGVLVGLVAFRLHRRLARPLAGDAFVLTDKVKIDARLVAGSAVFGVGWGIAGFCPGPAVANLGVVPGAVLPFVIAMLVGSWIAGAVLQRQETTAHRGPLAAPG